MNSNHFSVDRHQTFDEIGFLILNEDGSIAQSSGDLENDGKTAKILSSIVDGVKLYESSNQNDSHINNLTIQFDDYFYTLLLSKKITIIKRKFIPSHTIEA